MQSSPHPAADIHEIAAPNHPALYLACRQRTGAGCGNGRDNMIFTKLANTEV